MKRGFILFSVGVSVFSVAVSYALAKFDTQDSPASQSPAGPQAASGQPTSSRTNTTAEPKKAKKVWTNENLTEVSGSVVSEVGDARNSSSGKSTTVKPASSQAVAYVRKQLAALQAQLADIDKQIADLKSFSKGEASGASGMQLHKGYTMEPVQNQVAKLEEKRKIIAAQMDAVFDAARKRGIEPGQLR
jgi:hypothetical protein